MVSLDNFSKSISLIASGIGINTNKLVKKVALVADQTVVIATPVDKGRARSNWITNLNSASSETIEPYSAGDHLGTGETANAAGAISQGSGVIAQRKSGQDIHITNNLPYIGKLNDGSSAQAPSDFVQKAVQASVSTIKETKVVKK